MKKILMHLVGAGLLLAAVGCAESQEDKVNRHIADIKDRMGKAEKRSIATSRLVKLGKPIVPRLIKELKNNDNTNVRAYVCLALGRIGDDDAEEPLKKALTDEEPEVRARACEGLAELLEEKAIPLLIEMLKDNQSTPREQARITLATKIGEPAITPLIECFQKSDEFLRTEAQNALEQIGTKAVPQLISALSDTKGDVVVYVAKTLAAIGDKSALEPIKEAYERFKGPGQEKIHKSIKGAFDQLRQK
jgi:HEAT repeat protein